MHGVHQWCTEIERLRPEPPLFPAEVVPRRSMNGATPESMPNVLVPNSSVQEVAPTLVSVALASLLSSDQNNVQQMKAQLGTGYGGLMLVDPRALGFAEYVAHSNVLPFENSPLSGASVASLANGVGATVGFAVATHLAAPWLFVTVPAGIIVCVAATEIGQQLGKSIAELIAGLVRH